MLISSVDLNYSINQSIRFKLAIRKWNRTVLKKKINSRIAQFLKASIFLIDFYPNGGENRFDELSSKSTFDLFQITCYIRLLRFLTGWHILLE